MADRDIREPDILEPVFGLLAEFGKAEQLVHGIRQLEKAGFRQIDAYSPFPIEELSEIFGHKDNRIAWLTLAGGITGALGAYGMQAYANIDFPIEIGNRPLLPLPAFMLVIFELAVLGAVLFCIGGMLVLNHLPRLYHPVFNVPTFHLASADKFFLIVFSNDRKFDLDKTRAALDQLSPLRINLVTGESEVP
jgi:hypothetical protein